MPVQTRSGSRARSVASSMATPRRSTRIAARTPSVTGSDAGSDTEGRRVDRTSKSPTNAGQVGRLVTTRITSSRAYGANVADDRASAEPEAMDAPNAQQGFASSFSRQRERVRAPTVDARGPLPEIPEASESSNNRSKTSSINSQSNKRSSIRDHAVASHHSSISNYLRDRTPSVATDDERPPTRDTHTSSIGITKSWNDLRETAFIAWAHYSPAWYAIAHRTLRNIFSPIFAVLRVVSKFSAMVLGLLFSILFFYILFDMTIRTVLFRTINASDYMRERSAQIIHLIPGSGPIIQPYPISDDQHGKFSSVYNNIVQVQNKVGLLEKDIEYLKRRLPDSVILTHNPKTGRNEIPGAFWHALRDNLANEGLTTGGGSGNTPSWDDFWKHNKAHLDAYLSDAVDVKLKDAIKDDAPVDKDTFIRLVQDQFSGLETRVANTESMWSKKLDAKLRDFVAGLPKGQMSTMANAVLLENSWSTLHSVNFFSKALGAVVDPHLTSPTMASSHRLRQLFQRWTWIPGDLPPAAVLVGWEEPTDCWCAARSPGSGRAQIGVITPHTIVPETLVVEHIPRDGTLDIGSAPRGMEVWVEVGDDAVRDALKNNDDDDDDDKPGPKFVRVGSFEYRVDAINHVQAFDLNSKLLAHHGINKVVVRVTGTWGRDWACLYRLRLTGRPVEDFSRYVE